MPRLKLDWLHPGAEVFWTDPDTESACSCYAKVDFVHTEGPITADSVVILRRDDGTTFEARADELSQKEKEDKQDSEARYFCQNREAELQSFPEDVWQERQTTCPWHVCGRNFPQG